LAHICILHNALPMARIVQLATGAIFIVLGNYMGRVKRNWTIACATDDALRRHRLGEDEPLGGMLFVAAGVLALLGAFLPPYAGSPLIVLPIFVILPVTYVYSMQLYKKLHPGAMARDTSDGLLGRREPGHGRAARGGDGDPPSQRIEVVCPACGAENAPGKRVHRVRQAAAREVRQESGWRSRRSVAAGWLDHAPASGVTLAGNRTGAPVKGRVTFGGNRCRESGWWNPTRETEEWAPEAPVQGRTAD